VIGAGITRQSLDAGLIDEILVHLATVLFGDGVRLFSRQSVPPAKLERISVVQSGQLADLRFRVVK
jgi:riboflavin biosynthesis pyrimidine reductase